jgi:stress response protein SCP2
MLVDNYSLPGTGFSFTLCWAPRDRQEAPLSICYIVEAICIGSCIERERNFDLSHALNTIERQTFDADAAVHTYSAAAHYCFAVHFIRQTTQTGLAIAMKLGKTGASIGSIDKSALPAQVQQLVAAVDDTDSDRRKDERLRYAESIQGGVRHQRDQHQ